MAARCWPRLGARAPSGTDLPFGDSDKTYQQSLSRRIGQGEVEKHFRDPPNAPHSGPTTAGTFSTAGFRAGAGLSRAAIARAPLPSRFGVDFFFLPWENRVPLPFHAGSAEGANLRAPHPGPGKTLAGTRLPGFCARARARAQETLLGTRSLIPYPWPSFADFGVRVQNIRRDAKRFLELAFSYQWGVKFLPAPNLLSSYPEAGSGQQRAPF